LDGSRTAFEWDPAKARANLRKHGIDFADAVAALEDERAITVRDELSAVDEHRFLTLGREARGRLVVVAFTWRAASVRLISARPATARERRQYLEARP
jgi:uncharacterized DUF497 family protein